MSGAGARDGRSSSGISGVKGVRGSEDTRGLDGGAFADEAMGLGSLGGPRDVVVSGSS